MENTSPSKYALVEVEAEAEAKAKKKQSVDLLYFILPVYSLLRNENKNAHVLGALMIGSDATDFLSCIPFYPSCLGYCI